MQYQTPWFRALAAVPGLDVQVYYGQLPDASQQGAGFGVDFEWDLPLLEGYSWKLLHNRAKNPSLDAFRGCNVGGIERVLADRRPDMAVVTGWHSLYLVQALAACRRLRIPAVVRGDSNALRTRGRIRKLLQHSLLKCFSGYLAVGKLNRELYEKAGVKASRIYFCPHFVDNQRFHQEASRLRRQRSELRRRWQVPGESVCFMFAGKLAPRKRVMDFLAALDRANRALMAVRGLIVGTGEEMTQAVDYAEKNDVPVTFAGFLNQKEIAAAYVAADCLVLPSDFRETWGLVVNEAFACGIPAIVSDEVGCGPDLVFDGETGYRFKTGDIDELFTRIEWITENLNEAKRMGDRACELVNSRYLMTCATRGLMAAVNDLLAHYASGPPRDGHKKA